MMLNRYQDTNIEKLADLLRDYLAVIPDARLFSPGFYTYHPNLAGGQNAFWTADEGGQMTGFAALFPALASEAASAADPPDIWAIVVARPGTQSADEIRSMLLEAVLERAGAVKSENQLARLRLAADMMVSQREDIGFLLRNGFTPFDEVIAMRRDAGEAPSPTSLPPRLTLYTSRLEDEKEQHQYLRIYNTCFPEAPHTLKDLQFLLNSPMWEKGCIIAASYEGGYSGSILLYWGAEGTGVLDDVMVLPSWRGQGIAKTLVAESIRYFQTHGAQEIRLDVKASNAPAIAVYASMGFREVNRIVLLGQWL